MTGTYDSRGDTYEHSLRVGQFMAGMLAEGMRRAVTHDLSKGQDPELSVFNEYTPKLADDPYGSDQYKQNLAEMAPALEHHYAHNPHHPEFHEHGISGMTLVDLMEMLADWRASTERNPAGDLVKSFRINAKRFGMTPQLVNVLTSTAIHFGWIPADTPLHLDTTGQDATAHWVLDPVGSRRTCGCKNTPPVAASVADVDLPEAEETHA